MSQLLLVLALLGQPPASASDGASPLTPETDPISTSSSAGGEVSRSGASSDAAASSDAGAEQRSDQHDASEKRTSYYLIGNSLTWDTVPGWLDGDVQWHVDCGVSLPYIDRNPEMPCVKTSTLWPKALDRKQYDFLSVQPHYGSTLKEDVRVISKWAALQPDGVIVVHTGWAHHKTREAEYSSQDITGRMEHSPAYFEALLEALREKFPERRFRQTHAIDLLNRIAADIAAGDAPFADVAELHRDKIHMKTATGRYLMHNCMRHALGQPRSDAHFPDTSEPVKAYLDSVLDTLPEWDQRTCAAVSEPAADE